MRADVGRPQIAVAVDLQPVRPREHAVAERTDERAVRIELEERLRAARQHVNVAARVERHGGRGAHLRARGERDRIGNEHIVELGRCLRHEECRIGRPLREDRRPKKEAGNE
jgi:hypothetical protein